MSLTFTFLGQSGFLLDDGTHKLVIDPFLNGNPVAVHEPSDLKCGWVALTHGHEDHFGDTLEIAKANDATVIGTYEICNYVGEQGIQNVEPGNPGGTIRGDFGTVTFTHAFHSSSHQGRYMGMPCGLVVHMGGVVFYHLGDTGLFGDLQLYGELYKPDVAAVPVGDRFTMDAKLGTRAAQMVGPQYAIPVHYRTFPLLAQDITGFDPQGIEVKELAPGDSWSC
jgi:L-ascorbate metabolism protein UlaG (beta-lactamase superfamily)